jgi:hypothetical protein
VSVPPQSKMTALTAMPRILRTPTVSPFLDKSDHLTGL